MFFTWAVGRNAERLSISSQDEMWAAFAKARQLDHGLGQEDGLLGIPLEGSRAVLHVQDQRLNPLGHLLRDDACRNEGNGWHGGRDIP